MTGASRGQPPYMGNIILFDRISNAYPFGAIDLPVRPETHTKPRIVDGAKGAVAAANGAAVLFTDGVSLLRGESEFTADGDGSSIIVGTGSTFENSLIRINGTRCSVIVGDHCRIRGLKIIVRRPNSMVVIGSRTTWESGAIISESGNIVAVGNDCMMSNGVILRTSDGHTIFDAATKAPINDSSDLFIGHHVWLGNSARVSKGARIGSGTIVGQCSIASGKLEPNSIYAGAPARRIRQGVVWSRTPNYEDIPPEFLVDM